MQRPGDEMGPFAAIAGAETAPTRKFGRHVFEIAALLRVSDILYNYRVWVVGVMGIELVTPSLPIGVGTSRRGNRPSHPSVWRRHAKHDTRIDLGE